MLKKEYFKTKADVMHFIKDKAIDISRIVLIVEKTNSFELVYK